MHDLMRSLRRFARFVRIHKSAILIYVVGGCFAFGGLLMLWAATLNIPATATVCKIILFK